MKPLNVHIREHNVLAIDAQRSNRAFERHRCPLKLCVAQQREYIRIRFAAKLVLMQCGET